MSPYRELSLPKPIKQKSNWKNNLKCFLYGHDFLLKTPNIEIIKNNKTKFGTYYSIFALESEITCSCCDKIFKKSKEQFSENMNLDEFIEITNLLISNFENLTL